MYKILTAVVLLSVAVIDVTEALAEQSAGYRGDLAPIVVDTESTIALLADQYPGLSIRELMELLEVQKDDLQTIGYVVFDRRTLLTAEFQLLLQPLAMPAPEESGE
ncbi:MAG: hypothetical protein CMO30_15310 [Tistrella sp.]|uniref:hypothetical protein n=1 Tax=Tistrella sp. TaxID=2024861 RepID=UPI000C3BF5CB|nr:hypothetical protein [Tistrella sp.]MAD39220.1 hypothetical protein [Tistrella sp.]MBA76582.1 hypothetical protein [Tistrella sp.]MBA76636.1 hypothetical protein [Tistrella sp.]